MGYSFEIIQVAYHKFTAPDMPIGTIPCTIECNAYHFFVEIMLGHAGRNMCMVMLHLDYREIAEFKPGPS